MAVPATATPPARPASPRSAILALTAVTAVWGSTFVVVQDAVSVLPVMDFLAVRFALAAVIMLALRPRCIAALPPRMRARGAALGVPLAVGYILQTVGLQYAAATVSGFITGMFVVLTPLAAWAIGRERVGGTAWAGVALATLGLAALSLDGAAVGYGEAVTLVAAAAFAVHIVLLGRWSVAEHAYGLAVLQLLTVAVMTGSAALPGGVTLPTTPELWGQVLFLAIAATALAFVVQTWAQAHLSATRAAVVMTMEPVFAGVFGVAAGDPLTVRLVVGGGLVLAAMLLVELGPRHAADAALPRLEA